MSFTQIAVLGTIVLIGSIMGFWMRRFEMQGFELWLPTAIIVSYAISPLMGFVVAMCMILISFMLHPFNLQNILVMGACLVGVVFGTTLIPISQSTFAFNGMLLVGTYIVSSSLLTTLVGYELVRNVKFAAFTIFFNYMIFHYAGWRIFSWFGGLA